MRYLFIHHKYHIILYEGGGVGVFVLRLYNALKSICAAVLNQLT